MDSQEEELSTCGACGRTFTHRAGHGCGDSHETRELREALARATGALNLERFERQAAEYQVKKLTETMGQLATMATSCRLHTCKYVRAFIVENKIVPGPV